MKDNFSKFHPIVNFIYFAIVILFSMFFMHPVFLIISIFSSLVYSIYLGGKKSVNFISAYVLPMIALVMIINPAFNHQGTTIITYLPTGNPLTLESIIYGGASAILMGTIIIWFSCLSKVLTSDKFMYIFGRVIPSLSLILSMTSRFVPRFKEQFKKVSNAQKCIGRDISSGTILERLKNAINVFSIMVSWSLENSIETADSMKSRGYGLKGRTNFTIFSFEKRDLFAVLAILLNSLYILVGTMSNKISYRYFPSIRLNEVQPYSITLFLAYLFLCNIPMIINIKEDISWKYLKSKI